MTQNVLIDYAAPMLAAETNIKKAHDALLHNDYDLGMELMLEALVDAKMTLNAIQHMKDLRNALRQQATPV
jgi:hypothetical protein